MVYKRQLYFKHGCPSGCDTSKLLSDDLKNKLYYDGFQKVLYNYSHQTRKIRTISRKRRVRVFCFWRRAPPHNKSIRSAWPGCFSSGAVRCGCLFFRPRPLSLWERSHCAQVFGFRKTLPKGRYELPLRGSWHCGAMTERVILRNYPTSC